MIEYLSRKQVAERIGVKPDSLSRGLPAPDAMIGDVKGWLATTVDAWQASRPGQGRRSDLDQTQLGVVGHDGRRDQDGGNTESDDAGRPS